MALLVQKFGGSSVADAEKIANVARRVAECAPGNQLVVVVSAMGKTTDGLLTLARQISSAPDLREMEFLPGDAFLFCSDGLTTMLSDEEIRDCVAVDETKDAEALCQDLVDLANDKGGVDNITVVIVRIPDAKAAAKPKK